MEYLAAASILGLGYMFQTEGTDKNNKQKYITQKVKPSKIPTSKNGYDSNRAFEVWQKEQSMADDLKAKSAKPQDTNIITAGPPYKEIYNKVDYSESSLPIEFNQFSSYESSFADLGDPEKSSLLPKNLSVNNKQIPESGGFKGISLTGDAINPNTFTHNNMQPFFGSGVKQNLDEFATRGIFETFTGTQDNYQKKKEIGLMFEPQKNVTNVYGTSNLDGYMLDRYQVSQIRSNETPVERTYVGPGLNQGYTSTPSGGFQQADTLDYIMPKSTNELRVKTNPKLSYYGRINSGQKISKPGKVGTVFKNRPDTFYIQNPDRYLTTTGAVTAQAIRPCQIVKFTNRKTTTTKSRKGPAAPVNGTRIAVRGKYRVSDKPQFESDGPRNATLSGLWNLLGFGNDNKDRPDDYGKKGMNIGSNNRTDYGAKGTNGNLKGNEKGTARNGQSANETKRQSIEDSKRNGNMGISTFKSKVYDPNQKAKTTVRETTEDNEHNGQLKGPNRGKVYDPEDIAKNTGRQTIEDNDHFGNMNQSRYAGQAYDPNDVTRTTGRQTIEDNEHNGNLSGGKYTGKAYDPNDVTRTTGRQTIEDNDHNGHIRGPNRGKVYDPNEPVRDTLRQDTEVNTHNGNMGQGRYAGKAYDPNDVAKDTLRQDTENNTHNGNLSGGVGVKKGKVFDPNQHLKDTTRQDTSVYYVGNQDGDEVGGYQVTEVEAPTTMRQFQSVEYTGNAGNSGTTNVQMSRENAGNMNVRSARASQDRGYTPNARGANRRGEIPAMNTKKVGDIQSAYLNERGLQPSQIYNSIPQVNQFNETTLKNNVPNEPLEFRNCDVTLLRIFITNPYTQSLQSWA